MAASLHEAVRAGDLVAVDAHLDAGVDPGLVVDGKSALAVAIVERKWPIARHLLDRGAPIDEPAARMASGMGARFVAHVRRMRAGEVSQDLVIGTIAARDLLLLRRVLAAGAPASAYALGFAAEIKLASFVDVLLAAGAPADAPGMLHRAVRDAGVGMEGAVVVVDRLLDAGAAIDGLDESGRTALMVACADGAGVAARRLVERGARLDVAEPARKMTALAYARTGTPSIVAELVARGAPDRQVRRPPPGELLAPEECDLCREIPAVTEGRSIDSHLTHGLEVVESRTEHPDATTTDWYALLRCPCCGTRYDRYESTDIADVPASPPFEHASLKRRTGEQP